MARFARAGLALAAIASAISQPASAADDPWTLTRDVELVSRWPGGGGMREDKVTADLYRPRAEGRVPAVVIINSSGGVSPVTEIFYARLLARNGAAGLVVDSFRPRGVRRTGDDQNRVSTDQSNADAVAGFRWLAAQPWVDASRIVVLGMSRGAEAAYSAALETLRRRLQATDIRFAAHVALSAGSCNFQQRDVRTTGAPIFFMLAELDDGTPVMPCVEYVQRMRAAGNGNIRLAVYPGVYHAFEYTGGIGLAEKDWTGRTCAGRFYRDNGYVLYDRATGKRATQGNQTDYLFKTCLEVGYTVGGEDRVKMQASADLLQFLRDVEVLRDEEARAVVPDCASLPDGIVRRNCVRARNGWRGDLVGLARGLRGMPGRPPDHAAIARLFELAVARGDAIAQWELSLMLRQGVGVARDPARALALARASAEAGDAAGANVYGVMIRDGIARPRDDAEAAVWFRRAADLRNSYGMVNLGRLHWEGRGGVARDRPAAVALWRHAIHREDNPWAQLLLAEALEAGEGVAKSLPEAIALYQAAAKQDREPDVKRRAAEALSRLQPK